MFTRRAAAAGRGVLQTLRVSPGSKRGGDEEVRGLAAAGVAGAAGCCETHTCHITEVGSSVLLSCGGEKFFSILCVWKAEHIPPVH